MSEQDISLSQLPEESGTPDNAGLPEGWLRVTSLDMEAQGIARRPDGKVVFIEGALPYEKVTVNVHRKKITGSRGHSSKSSNLLRNVFKRLARISVCKPVHAAVARCSTCIPAGSWR